MLTQIGSVGVGGLLFLSAASDDVVVGILGPSSVAALGSLVALHDLLRAQDVVQLLDAHVVGLDLLSGRERPA